MPGFSSDQMHEEWVYAIKQDFQSADGTPATYAPGMPLYWGSERAKIELEQSIRDISINSDATLLAVIVGNDIHIYETDGLGLRHVLKGHTSTVNVVAFQPGSPSRLVSCAMNANSGTISEEPNIIYWDFDDPQQQRSLETEAAVRTLGGRAVASIVAGLEESGSKWMLNDEEKATLLNNVTKSITTLNIKYSARNLSQLSGRLVNHFQSQVFSHDGSSMIYLPGQRPRSNTVDRWDICVWDTTQHELRLRLEGHTDAIMWMGFSPNDKLLASVCWDKTIRIWDAESGAIVHKFTTTGQNWTGAFSPDSCYFTGTCGDGNVNIWDLGNGAGVASYHFKTWCRALDWSADGKQLVMGGKGLGRIVVFDVQTKKIVQERVLSTKRTAEKHFLEVQALRFLPGGRKIAYQTTGDEGLEVYDLVDNRKWRFAPKKGQATGYGSGFVLMPRQGLIASVNGDVIRFWDLQPSEGDEWRAP